MSSLLSFVQTGRLGAIDLGAPRSAVERAFGPPADWMARFEAQLSPIWKYGNIELHFDADDKVFLLFCDDFNLLIEAPVAFDVGELGQGTEEDIESWLRHHEIQFEREPFPWDDCITVIRTISGVELNVYTDDSLSAKESNIARLCSISRRAR